MLGGMKTIALILLGLLAAWWCVLTLWAISCHRDRVRLAANWTPENETEYRESQASTVRYHMRPKDYVVTAPFMIPFIFVLLPLYLWDWLVKDPFKDHDHAANNAL
jgi:ABC-type nickel/cobalt efflux system permease component RcnA